MVRNILALIILSILAIIFLSQAHYLLQLLPSAFIKCERFLATFMPADFIGWHVRYIIALIIVPLIIGAVAQLIYVACTRQKHVAVGAAVTWATWLALVAMIH